MSRGEEALPRKGTGAIRFLIIDDVLAGDAVLTAKIRVQLQGLARSMGIADVVISGVSGPDWTGRPLERANFAEAELRVLADPHIANVPYPIDYSSSVEEDEKSYVRPASCSFARRYQGFRPPTCWKGRGCAACVQKFKERQSRGSSSRGGRKR